MGNQHPTAGGHNAEPESEFVVVDKRPSYDESDPAPAETPSRYPTVVEQLKARAEEAEARAREISAAYRKIDAERDAFRERLNRDLERRVDIARGEMMRKVVGVLDDLDRALGAAQAGSDPSSLVAGVRLIRDRLFQVLASEGVEAIETLGHPFDPAIAEAVATAPTKDTERDGTIVEELEKGYTLGGTLLRPARVRVARSAPPPPRD